MRNRLFIALIAIALVAAFAILNWSTLLTPTPLSLGFFVVEAPLGLAMLGLTAVVTLVFAVYMAVWQGKILLETRLHAKELQMHRTLADQAEASRFTELQAMIRVEFEKLAQQLKQSQEVSSRELRENVNSLAAMLAEMDDRTIPPTRGAGE